MNGKEITQLAMELEKPPRIPVGLITGGEWYVNQAGKTFAEIKSDPKALAQVFTDGYRKTGQDFIWTGAGILNYPIHFLGCPMEDESSDSPKLMGTVIKRLDELESLDIQRLTGNPLMQGMIQYHRVVADEIGKECLIMSTQWGPFTVAARILGVEAMLMAAIENPEKLQELIQFSSDLCWAITEPVLEHPDIPCMNLSEPVASCDVISPGLFRQFVKPVLIALLDKAKAKGKYTCIHICGNSTPLLSDILDIEPTSFSIEAKVDLKTAKEVLGGKVCVLGNVSPTGNFLSGTPEDVIREGKECLKAWGDDPGYMLTVGCDFPKAVPLENVMALMSLKGME